MNVETNIDFIIFYGDNSCDGVIEEKPNMKAMIEYVTTTNDKKTKCCNICCESNNYISKCINCNFFTCKKCEKRLIECPQCKYSKYDEEERELLQLAKVMGMISDFEDNPLQSIYKQIYSNFGKNPNPVLNCLFR